MKEDLLKIIYHYGREKQLKYIHTEYYELDEAILKGEYNGYNDFVLNEKALTHIAEEIADIMVMLKQFQYYYTISDEEIEKTMQYKIKRQLERIEKEKENETIE